ncbi:hypothetical protein JXQ70_11315 [bacterium]|nr:hypothetical protein [bacterium]
MTAIWNSTHHIRNYDVDFTNRLKIAALFNYLQDAASVHAEMLDVGYSMLTRDGLYWVLAWIKLSITHYPQFAEHVSLKTWPKCSHKMFSIRDFAGFNGLDKRPFCRATSAWVLLDAVTRKVRKLDTLPHTINYQQDMDGLTDLPVKLPALIAPDFIWEKEIKYSDIDANNHVNNARYIESLLDSYDSSFYADHIVLEVTVSFLAEMKEGEHMVISRQKLSQPAGCHLLSGHRREDGKEIIRAAIVWQKESKDGK